MGQIADEYERRRRAFSWSIPRQYNIGVDCCDRWALADPDRTAIVEIGEDDRARAESFGALRAQSNRIANALRRRGIGRGDCVALLLPQSRHVAAAHIAIYKLGAVALPLASLFGVDALTYRLGDSLAKALICDASGLTKIREIEPQNLAALQTIFCLDGAQAGSEDFFAAVEGESTDFTPVETLSDDPALMIYTSGTTGPAKGALHGHRVLLGHLPGVRMPHDDFPQPGDLMWTPADWAWAGGLLNVLLPSLHFGVAVVARPFRKFDPEAAFALIAAQGVRNVYIPPTALRMMRAVQAPRQKFDFSLRSVNTGGESLGAETFHWGRAELGLTINESFGQTECNLVLASSALLGVNRPGAIGKPVPGHEVAVIRPDGTICDDEETGEIAVRRPDPVMFLSYWRRPEATAQKFLGDWLLTGDRARRDADGYVFFQGRDDDVISSAGYRIGPTEIEDVLLRHPAVANAAAVGKPDALRGEIVKAFIVLKPGFSPSPELAKEIQRQVKTRLSAHENPREIEFVAEMPLTTSGKIIRRLLREKA
ncbi:AMP-binding protein [uncultured Rhodoblastus sp.]|uniref:AMP-binding protein n=1 Tax=uncultured Rhodoblastus sp. TaxID=543037 RepID=UPI0025E93E63|nr:AMP-binding protein [uncultured Rhodoblastus sp.]